MRMLKQLESRNGFFMVGMLAVIFILGAGGLFSDELAGKEVIDDGELAVEFSEGQEGFFLEAIGRVEGDILFSRAGEAGKKEPLFKITLRGNDGKGTPEDPYWLPKDYESPPTDELVIDNFSACTARHAELQTGAGEKVLALRWEGVNLKEEVGVLDVTVTLTVKEGEAGIAWRIKVDNRSERYGVWLVDFPRIKLQPVGDSPENDYLVYPRGIGRLVKNPFDKLSCRQHGMLEEMAYPRVMNMQWLAVYDEDEGGLYLGTHDATAHHKNFNTRTGDDGLRFWVTHYPANMGQRGNGYQAEYPLVMRYTPGNWYDATQIYRRWALGQVWSSKGPLSERTDIPKWYIDAPMYFVTYSFDKTTDWAMVERDGITCGEYADRAIRYQEFFGYDKPIPMIWYQWATFRPDDTSINDDGVKVDTGGTHAAHPYPAKPGFGEALAKLNEHLIYAEPYINTRVYDLPGGFPPVPAELEPYVTKDVNGRPRGWSGEARWKGLVDLCRYTEFHQQLVCDNAMKLIKEFHAKGAYLDQFAELSHACFDARHGHDLGGGDYQFYGIRAMAQKVRQTARQDCPDAIFTGENGSDAFIDVLDGMLIHRDIFPGIIPVRAAVYGEYWIGYGRHVRAVNLKEDRECRMTLGNHFVYKIKIGRVNVQNPIMLDDPTYKKNMELLKQLVHYKYAARDYLNYGRMLRPVVFENSIPEVNFAMPDESLARYNSVTRQPAIMSSVWEAPDGSMGIVLFNISQEPQPYAFQLDAKEYPVLTRYAEIHRLWSDGRKDFLDGVRTGTVKLEGRLGPDEVFIYTIREAKDTGLDI